MDKKHSDSRVRRVRALGRRPDRLARRARYGVCLGASTRPKTRNALLSAGVAAVPILSTNRDGGCNGFRS